MLKETFISKAVAVHGDKYDYSQVCDTINTHGKVTIVCRKHGAFEQEANSHMRGSGCEKCSYEERGMRHRAQGFIERAKLVHGDRYDYSKTVYELANKKVTIICPVHGEFQQTPSAHLKGCGCFKCGRMTSGLKKRKDEEKFIEHAHKIHGDKYSYENVVYVNSTTKVDVICKKHGVFSIAPFNLLSGKGCSKCYYEATSERIMLTTEEFIDRSNIVHGGKYDYSKSVYTGKENHIKIICPTHGEFEQIAGHHMRGCGCPHCKRSLGEERIAKFLYSRNIKFTPQYKLIIDNLFVADKILRVDFFLPEYKTFIEFNGLQHYHPVDLFGGEEKLISQQERDYALRLYCKEKKLHLLEIPYNEFGNIEGILKRSLRI